MKTYCVVLLPDALQAVAKDTYCLRAFMQLQWGERHLDYTGFCRFCLCCLSIIFLEAIC